tara:strand:+ start:1479 stop:1595 length:117 start_codon:yes stop_codon:yes gene_type:complete
MSKVLLFTGKVQLRKEIIYSGLFDDIYFPKGDIFDFKN